MKWRWKWFEPGEVLSHDGLKVFHLGVLLMDDRVLDALTAVREEIDCAVTVNTEVNLLRGYRSQREHDGIPEGAKYSQHLFGRAADVSIYRLSFAEMVEVLRKHFTFVKPYPAQKFCHCDFGFRLDKEGGTA